MSSSLRRKVADSIFDYVSSGLNRDGWSRVHLYDAFPENAQDVNSIIASGLPAVTIEVDDNFDDPLELGGGNTSNHVITIDIFGNFKNEKDDLTCRIKTYFDTEIPLNSFDHGYSTPSGTGGMIDFGGWRDYKAPRDESAVDDALKNHQIATLRAMTTRDLGEY